MIMKVIIQKPIIHQVQVISINKIWNFKDKKNSNFYKTLPLLFKSLYNQNNIFMKFIYVFKNI